MNQFRLRKHQRQLESYYEALQESSYNWHEEENDYQPFVKYMLGIIIAAYRDFTDRAALLTESYYEALQESSYNWHEEENDYQPFVKYMLGIIIAAYRDFTDRAALLTNKAMSKPDRIREIIKGTLGKITKAEIME